MPVPVPRCATLEDLDALAPLFDAYRRFYEQPADLERARAFLRSRLERDEAIVFLADERAQPCGFCLLYPAWCSVSASRTFVLSDLFVVPEARRNGVARALMRAAKAFARDAGAVRIELQTARRNVSAQALYESLGWQRDDLFFTYALPLGSRGST